MELNSKQNKKITIFAIFLSVLSLALLIFGFSLVSSDKVVMLQSISNLSNKFSKIIENDSTLISKISTTNDIGLRGNISFSGNGVNAKASFDYLENKIDKKSKLEFDTTLNDAKLLGLDLQLANDKAYFFVDDVTPRYYHTAFEYINIFNSMSESDYDKILALLKESINDYINNEDIEKQKLEITYNGKSKKVNKLTYKVTNKVVKDICTNFINSIKKDKLLLSNIASYTKQSEENIINTFDELLKKLAYSEEETYFYYNVYYYGFNKIVKYELVDPEDNVNISYKIDNNQVISIVENNKTIFELTINKNKQRYDYNGFIETDDGDKYSFSGNLNNNTLTFVLNFLENIDYKAVITFTKEEKDNTFSYNNNIALSIIDSNVESSLGKMNIYYEYYFNQTIDTTLNDSVDISEITEEDINTIQENITSNPIFETIINFFSNREISL